MNNENNIKNCIISRYDKTIKEAPFLTIQVDSVEVSQPLHDDGSVNFAIRLKKACLNKGYEFRFYTLSDVDGYDYEIVVE